MLTVAAEFTMAIPAEGFLSTTLKFSLFSVMLSALIRIDISCSVLPAVIVSVDARES